jgi:Tol biopolymer transport system component
MRADRSVIAFAAALLLAALPDPGAAQYFGRNKVQYRSFDFEIIRTDHFDVYYYRQEREAALDAGRMAERAYARLAQLLRHEFRERKPVVLYASHTDFQQTNITDGLIDEGTAAFAEAIKSRLVLPFTGSYADFDHVFTHELVHAFQHDVIYRRGLLNEATPFAARLPLWFMEGMAEYLSRGRIDPHTSSWLRDATLNGYLRSIAEMSARDDYLSYRFGQSLWQYIGARWGDEVVGILLQKTPRMGVERAFASTLGSSLSELSQEWQAAVRRTYLPQLAEFSRPEHFSQKLTQHDRLQDPWFLSPAVSPDGKLMVYLSQREGFFFDLWLADAQNGKPLRKLISAARNGSFESLRFLTSGATFSADGRYLAFAAQTGGRDALYLYDLQKGRVLRRLRFTLDGIEAPSFSPDGQHIVFSGNDGGLSDLFVTDLQGRLTRLTSDRHADLLPSWSPDGAHIAFSTDRGPEHSFERLHHGNLRVALFELATQKLMVLPEQDRGKNINPVWAPDSKSLVWVNDATGTNNLYLFELGHSRLYRITNVLSGVIAVKDVSPVLSWSRSGRLLYTYFEKAGYNIYALDDPHALPRVPVVSATTAAPSLTAALGAAAQARTDAQARAAPGARTSSTPEARADKAADRAREPVRSFYRTGTQFRASAGKLERQEAPALPVSVTALLDSAIMALPDTGQFTHRDYKVKLTPDLIGRPTIGAQVGGHYGNGVYGGSYIALSDMLGDHSLLAAGNVNGSLSDASVFAGYNFYKTRANLGVAVEQLPLYRYYGSDYLTLQINGQAENVAASVFVRDVMRTMAVWVSYPFSTFQRLELGARGVYYKSDLLYRGRYVRTGEPLDQTERIDDLSYVQPMAALVFDNSLFGWTGPLYGRRYRAQVSRTLGSFAFTEGLLDFRNYWNYKQRVVLATRLTALTRLGADADRFSVYWGGPYYVRGYDARSFELQGAECQRGRAPDGSASLSPCPGRDQLIGSSAAFLNTELRVPIIKELQIGFLGSFPPVDLVTFFDGGIAWDNQACLRSSALYARRCAADQSRDVELVWKRRPGQDLYLVREPLFAYGAGLRLNVFYTVLRFDYALPLNRPDRTGLRDGIFSISFGPSF